MLVMATTACGIIPNAWPKSALLPRTTTGTPSSWAQSAKRRITVWPASCAIRSSRARRLVSASRTCRSPGATLPARRASPIQASHDRDSAPIGSHRLP